MAMSTFHRITRPGLKTTTQNTYGGERKHEKDCECQRCLELKPYSLRLAPSDIENIRWVFNDLEGLVALGSNFGHMCERIKQSQPPRPPKAPKPEPHEKGEIRLALADRRIGQPKERRQGVPPQLMFVRGTSYELRAYCSPLDAWCGPNVKGRNPKSKSVHTAWLALSSMVAWSPSQIGGELPLDPYSTPKGGENKKHIVTLYRMYGQDTSKLLTAQFPDLGDLVALVEDTDIITEHVVRMTKKLRKEPRARTFFVTPREAMSDLLEKRAGCNEEARKAAVVAVRLEANRMLIEASKAYRKAKGEIE